MLANSHHRLAPRTSRRGLAVLVCLFLALLTFLILSPRARAEQSPADVVGGLTTAATHAVSGSEHALPVAAEQPAATAPPAPVSPAPPAPSPAPTPIRTTAPATALLTTSAAGAVGQAASPSARAGAAGSTLDRVAGATRAAADKVVAGAGSPPSVNAGRPAGVVRDLSSRGVGAAADAPKIVAGSAGAITHAVTHATVESTVAGALLTDVARSTSAVTGTVEQLASGAPIERVTIPRLPFPGLAPLPSRTPAGAAKTPLQPAGALVPSLAATLADSTLPSAPAGAFAPGAESEPAIAPPLGASIAQLRALTGGFSELLQPASYALLGGYETPAGVAAAQHAPPARAPAHPSPAAPPGGLAPATVGGGGLSSSFLLALAGLLLLATPRALRRLGLVVEPSLQAPFALISARPG